MPEEEADEVAGVLRQANRVTGQILDGDRLSRAGFIPSASGGVAGGCYVYVVYYLQTSSEDRAAGAGTHGLEEIEELARHAEQNGLTVTVRRLGEERPLDGVVGDWAYRIVQEALTNVSRHASARNALVELRYGPASLERVVEDDGIGGGSGRNDTGHGLLGMRERVAVAGGELNAGPRPQGG